MHFRKFGFFSQDTRFLLTKTEKYTIINWKFLPNETAYWRKGTEKRMQDQQSPNRVFTIPNILTILRICMIPLIMWLYLAQKDYTSAAVWVLISGATDVVDGLIARHFHMVSNVGKILDPAADKLTQLAVMSCLVARFPAIALPLVVLVLKELTNGIIGLVMMKKSHRPLDSKWHGKAATVCIYLTMVLHLLWVDIPTPVSGITILVCLVLMILSFILYTIRNVGIIRSFRNTGKEEPVASTTENCAGPQS